MRFSEFLRTTVLISAAAASLLGVVGVLSAGSRSDYVALGVAVVWWVLLAALGLWSGRREGTSASIHSLLAGARTQAGLPQLAPTRIVLNRLWPLLLITLAAAAVAFVFPQAPIIGAGFAMFGALSWRRQALAVTAIEERDGARFYVEPTSPFQPIRLARTPGFRSGPLELDASSLSARSRV